MVIVFGLECLAVVLFWNDGCRYWKRWLAALGFTLCFVRLGVSFHVDDEQRQQE